MDVNLKSSNSKIEKNFQNGQKQKEKITQISQFVKKEKLLKNRRRSPGIIFNEISDDEEIFVFDVPKAVFAKNLTGEKIIFSSLSLTFGSDVYYTSQTIISPNLFCVFNTNVSAQDSYKIENIMPSALFMVPAPCTSNCKKFLTISEFEERELIWNNENYKTLEAANIDHGSVQYNVNNQVSSIKKVCKVSSSKNPRSINSKVRAKRIDKKTILPLCKKENKQLSTKELRINNENKYSNMKKPRNLTNMKKNISATAAAEEIKNIIGKVFKINEGLNADRSSSNANPRYETVNLNCLSNQNSKRYLSTSSSDDATDAFETSFKVEKTKKKNSSSSSKDKK